MRLSGTKTGAINQYRGLGNQLWDLAGNRPSLDLPFADNKSLVDATTGANLVDFTRASSGTYVDSEGVIRTATTNLLLRSEEFETTWGTFGLSVTANQETAPNGALTADLISINGSGQGIWQPVTSAPGVQYTFSVYVKLGTMSAANYKIAVRDDTAGVFIASDVEPTQAPSSNGWTRISYTATAPAGCTTIRFYAFRNTANVTGTIYLWGAQLEQSSTVGEYIPTTSTINSAPRFDHDPTTGESLGLLVEEQRTNLLLRSEEFETEWNLTNILAFGSGSTVNAIASPNGSVTADKVTEDTATGFHRIGQQFSHVAGVTYTFTVFVKAAERTRIHLQLSANLFKIALFDLATGTTANQDATIINYGNGWYRCSLTSTATTTSSASALVEITDDSGNRQYAGDGTSGIYLWGAQLEAGAFPTSYIPTTDATATRAADVASISGSNFSSWYRQDEGTVYTESTRGYSGNFATFSNLYNFTAGTTTDNSIPLYGLANNTQFTNFSIRSGGVNQTVYVAANGATSGLNRICQALETNYSAFVANGVATTPSTSLVMPVGIDRVSIGSNRLFVGQWNGTIKRLTYWPARLPNETLQTITQ
jgi:hypothetical protein